LKNQSVKATWFVPGNYFRAGGSEDFLKGIAAAGREIAAHGELHRLLYKALDRTRLTESLKRNKNRLELIIKKEVVIFKAPAWSINRKSLWIYDCLAKSGFKYDHSAMPNTKVGLGKKSWELEPFLGPSGITIIPPTCVKVCGCSVPFCGGFYSAYLPKNIELATFKKINNQLGVPFNYYFHPFEFWPRKKY